MPNTTRTLTKRKKLRDLLLDAIEQVKDGSLDPDRATAVAELSQAVLRVDQFELDAMAFAAEHGMDTALVAREPIAITHHEQVDDDEDTDDESEPEEIDEADEPPMPATKAAASKVATLIFQAVKKGQPMDLEDVFTATKIPRAECFQILKGDQFERDTDGFYWVRT